MYAMLSLTAPSYVNFAILQAEWIIHGRITILSPRDVLRETSIGCGAVV